MLVEKARVVLINLKNGNIAISISGDKHVPKLPGGKNKKGESIAKTAQRELHNETGISIIFDENEQPFYTIYEIHTSNDKNNNPIVKHVVTHLFLKFTYQDFDEQKMKLSKREKERNEKMYWLPKEKLKEFLNLFLNGKYRKYKTKYAGETLLAIQEYEKFIQKRDKSYAER